jgi:hypothetical protein
MLVRLLSPSTLRPVRWPKNNFALTPFIFVESVIDAVIVKNQVMGVMKPHLSQ